MLFILDRTLLRKRSIGKYDPKWEENIEKDLVEICCESMDWIQLA
jgi:hypothetical protein